MARKLNKAKKQEGSLLSRQREKLESQRRDAETARRDANVAQYEKEKAARATKGYSGYGYSQHLMGGSSRSSSFNTRSVREEVLVDYLLDEGFASDEKSAQAIANVMSEAWVESIVSEAFPVIDAVKGVGKKIGNYLNSPSNDSNIKRDPSYNPKTGKGDYKDPRKSSPRPGEVRTY